MSERSNGLTYARAGVDIDAGDALVERIKPLAKSTGRAGAKPSLDGFGALFDLKAAGYDDPLLVTTTDGVGTKLKVAIDSGLHGTVGVDLVAMCVNDLLAQGAEPLMFLDYYATGKLDVEGAASVVAGIAEGCRQAGCALVGGETAEMPGNVRRRRLRHGRLLRGRGGSRQGPAPDGRPEGRRHSHWTGLIRSALQRLFSDTPRRRTFRPGMGRRRAFRRWWQEPSRGVAGAPPAFTSRPSCPS